MNHQHYLKLARECTNQASYNGRNKVKVGCVIVYKGSVLAKGWNSDKTHTTQMRYNHYRYNVKERYCPDKVHAEAMALSKIRYLDIDFSKVVLYVYREYKDGSPAMARCCPSCMAAAKALGIKTICYSTDNGYAVEKIIS